jgi:hypothetical protein
LFNIYINKAIKEWKQTARNGIQLTSGERIKRILYADDQVIVVIAKSDDVQMEVNERNKIIKKYDFD